MIDKMLPIDFEISKKIHGHVRVETRDRWTGRVVDSQEKENLVTNAAQELLEAQVWMNSLSSNVVFTDMLPLHSKAFGGLLLFNGTLTESASNTSLPSSVKIVGVAGPGSDSVNAIKGSYNAQESGYTSNGFTTTWDFLTSQANGIIASLARTSYRISSAQNISCRASFCRGGVTFNSLYIIYLGYDKTNQYLYFTTTTAQTIGNVAYSPTDIYRAKMAFTNVGLLKSYLIPSKVTSIITLTGSDPTTTASLYSYDEYNDCFIYANGTTLYIIGVDGTRTTRSLPNTSGPVVATENYYWRTEWASGAATVYCISKTNVTDVKTFSFPNTNTWRLNIIPCENDIVVSSAFGSGEGPMRVFYPDGTDILIPDTSGASSSETANTIFRRVASFFVAGGNHDSAYYPSFYLGTIANLDSPITKTASQTMKITYTLTEA